MGEKETDNLEDIEDREKAETQEPGSEEVPKEQSGLQVVTPEQLLHLKLDNFSVQIEGLESKLDKLIKVLVKK